MYRTTDGNEKRNHASNERNGSNEKHEKQEQEVPRNYSQPEPLNVGLVGKAVTIVMIDNSIQAGILRAVGQYFILLEIMKTRTLIINKAGILTMAVN